MTTIATLAVLTHLGVVFQARLVCSVLGPGCACDPFRLSFALVDAPGFTVLRTGKDLGSKTEKERFSEPKRGNLVVSKKPVAPRPALQPSLSLFLSKAWQIGDSNKTVTVTVSR